MVSVGDQAATPEQQARQRAEAAFHASLTHVQADAVGGPYTCPCCGHRSLPTRGNYDLCPNCHWEDDGQDDHDSHLIRLGPNGGLSLDAAREVYRRTRDEPLPHHPPTDPVGRASVVDIRGPRRLPSPRLWPERDDAVVTGSWAIRHFSQSNPRGPRQGDVAALLRRVAASIEKLGAVDVQDVTFHGEVGDDGHSWPHVTVYFHESKVEP